MAHKSENSKPLFDRTITVKTWDDLFNLRGTNENIYVFHLDTESSYSLTEINNISLNMNRFFLKLPDECVICFIISPENALNLIPCIQKTLVFKLWISIRRDKPVIHNKSELPNAHIALIVFTKYKKSLIHCKTQIAYTYCPVCKKTTKDYGGKKHLYSPYGTLMPDVWRDITYPDDIFPIEIMGRLKDLFGLSPYKFINYVDLRQLTISNYKDNHNTDIKDRPKEFESNHPGESRLINKDCFEAFKEISDNSIDFAFADPPYNIKKKYHNWDDGIDIKEYFAWCDNWLDELARVIKPGRTVAVLNIPLWLVRHFQYIKYKLDFQSWITWEALGLPVRKIMPAHYGILCMSKGKARGAVGRTGNVHSDINELNMLKQCYCLRQSCIKTRNSVKSTDREELTDLWWDIHRLKHNSKRVDHPCQLPPQLMHRLIALYTFEGECVLDPFNGAGTSTLVAQELGRKFIGFELSGDYHKIALSRHDELESGMNPFAKKKCTPKAKNSRVKRLKQQKYAVPKKTLQLEVKRIAEAIGRIPTREDVKKHSSYPFRYYEEYFIDWGEVCSAVGDKGMKEESDIEYKRPHNQLSLFERLKRYKSESSRPVGGRVKSDPADK